MGTETSKQEALGRLQEKIVVAKSELETATRAAADQKEKIETKLREDGRGRAGYSPEALGKDRLSLDTAERQVQFARDTVGVLENVLPKVREAAIREEMDGLNESMTALDSERVLPAVASFIEEWNSMAATFNSIEAMLHERDDLERQFAKLAKSAAIEAAPVPAACGRQRLRGGLRMSLEFFLDREPGRRLLAPDAFQKKAGTSEAVEVDAAPERPVKESDAPVLSPNREDHVAWSRLPPSA
jgi:hypothetical protein